MIETTTDKGRTTSSFNEAHQLTTEFDGLLKINVWTEESDLDSEPTAIIVFKKIGNKYTAELSQTVEAFAGFYLDELQKLIPLMKNHCDKLNKFEKTLK